MRPVYGLITSTGSHKLEEAIRSLSDCDRIIVLNDAGRKGQNMVRNQLMEQVPDNAIVRYCDDDDVAMNTRMMARRLEASGVDVLAASFISGSVREIIPTDPLAAAIDSVGPWNFVASAHAIRRVPWDVERTCNTGAWQFLAFIDAGLRIGFAPDIWCYHWLAREGGVSATAAPDIELFQSLQRRIEDVGHFELFLPLMARISRAGMKVESPRLNGIGRRFKQTFGYYPNIRTPRTFSEKVVTRKAFDRNPMFETWCDKMKTRVWAQRTLGHDFSPELYSFTEGIPDEIPTVCFLKPNNSSGRFYAMNGEEQLSDAISKMTMWLAERYGGNIAEEQYLAADPGIICEELLPVERDLRVFVFDGKAKVVCSEVNYRRGNHLRDYFDANGNWLSVQQLNLPNDPDKTRPLLLREAVEISEALGRGVDFVRIDFVEARGRLYFTEATPFSFGGNVPFSSGFDRLLGDMWIMRQMGTVDL